MKKQIIILLCLPMMGFAQLTSRFEVFVSSALSGADGQPLEGNSPAADAFGFTVVPGCRVEILDAGADGVANPPLADGTPGGDDSILKLTAVGEGIAPGVQNSGAFSVSFTPVPAQGSKLYVRVFDAPTLGQAGHWGQSGVGTVSGDRLDAGALGLWGTTQAQGVDSTATDSDNDGMSDWEEAVAGTSAVSAADLARIVGVRDGSVTLPVVAGRSYVIYRSTDDLSGVMQWQAVASLPAQSQAAQVEVALPEPPAEATQVFYKYQVK